jgi:putative holliday junction resolvase
MSQEPGRLLGLDPGARRIGYALSDPTRALATPGGVFPNEGYDRTVARVSELVTRHEVTGLVIGLPLNMDDSEGGSARTARRLARKLEAALGLSVTLEDERLSSLEADEVMRERRESGGRRNTPARDAVAAALILERHMARVAEQDPAS